MNAQSIDKPQSFNLPEIILGGQDGLVNVLGIVLGLAAATSSNDIVIVAGLAATCAESISMAAVAYTSKITEADHYQAEYEREQKEIESMGSLKKRELFELYERYGFNQGELEMVVNKISANKDIWTTVIMEHKLRLEPINRAQVIPQAVIVGVSSFVGSLIPIVPFFFLGIGEAVALSLLVSAISLFLIGYYKATKTIKRNFVKQGVEMMVIGLGAAFVGYLIGTLLQVGPL